jgi:hypothetical protein
VFSGVSSFFKKDAEEPGDCWSGVVADEVDGIGDKGLGATTIVDSETVGLFGGLTDFGIIFLNCQSIRISVISFAGLKEFYCAYITCGVYNIQVKHDKYFTLLVIIFIPLLPVDVVTVKCISLVVNSQLIKVAASSSATFHSIYCSPQRRWKGILAQFLCFTFSGLSWLHIVTVLYAGVLHYCGIHIPL